MQSKKNYGNKVHRFLHQKDEDNMRNYIPKLFTIENRNNYCMKCNSYAEGRRKGRKKGRNKKEKSKMKIIIHVFLSFQKIRKLPHEVF